LATIPNYSQRERAWVLVCRQEAHEVVEHRQLLPNSRDDGVAQRRINGLQSIIFALSEVLAPRFSTCSYATPARKQGAGRLT
jgi:hypothetical protein